MAVLSPAAKTAFVDAAGEPLVGGLLYTYIAGTTTPQTTYTDSTAATANTNPIVLDSRGEANVWLGGAIYKFVLKDSVGALIWSVDNISAPTAAVSPVLSGNVTIDSNTPSPALKITQTGTGAVLRVQDSSDPDATPFIIDAIGQVGIGTAAPSAALEIASPGVFKGAWAYLPAGTHTLFFQTAAPTGWTQVTAITDRALRVVGVAGGGTGGTTSFSAYFSGSASVGSTAITQAQMPSHTHGVNDPGHDHLADYLTTVGGPDLGWQGVFGNYANIRTGSSTTGITIANTGSGSGHSHTIPSLQYADVIICTKD